MTMSTGWVSLADFGQPERYDFPSTFAVQGMANTFVTHVNHLRWPGQLSQVSLFQDVNVSCCLLMKIIIGPLFCRCDIK